MQLAGNNCFVCRRPIILSREGTWCAHCRALLHERCLPSDGSCPLCHTALIAASSFFTYAKRCPGCGRDTDRQEACGACGERLRWDTAEEYQAAWSLIHRTARSGAVKGTTLAASGVILMGGLVPLTPRLLLILGPCGGFFSLLLSALVIIPLAGLGCWCLFKAWGKLWASIPGMRFR